MSCKQWYFVRNGDVEKTMHQFVINRCTALVNQVDWLKGLMRHTLKHRPQMFEIRETLDTAGFTAIFPQQEPLTVKGDAEMTALRQLEKALYITVCSDLTIYFSSENHRSVNVNL
jgi:hypothetical protein